MLDCMTNASIFEFSPKPSELKRKQEKVSRGCQNKIAAFLRHPNPHLLLTHICLVDFSVLINWISPFPMGCRFTIYSLFMDIQNSFLDIQKCFWISKNRFMDILKYIFGYPKNQLNIGYP